MSAEEIKDCQTNITEENEEQEHEKPAIHYLRLLKYASSFELFLCIVGIIMSCLVGSTMPVSFLFFSDIINEFIYPTNSNINAIETLVQRFAIIGLATFFVAFWQMFCLQLSAKLQAKRIRRLFYEAVLRQDVAWFDKLNVGTAITQLTEGVDKIETGIGEKLGLCIQFLLIFVSGLIIGFTKNWKLSLVACSVFPLVVVAVGSMGLIMRKFSVKERVAYSKANGIAGEVLSSIRTIFAFEGQIKEMVRYESELGTAEKLGVRRSILFNCVLGCTDASVYVLIAVTFWYGIVMINDGDAAAGDIILVVFAMIFGGSTLGQSFQQFDHFNAAKVAAAEIYETIDRIPPIDKRTPGKIIEKLSGEIVFRNVCFEYPLRKDVKILQDFNLTIRSGQTVAIVGPSGSGKSTVIQLIQRFYDPSRGEIEVDRTDIRELDLKWFRSQLGVVSQEPVLFAGTVSENIRLGKLDATQEEIEAAAKLSGAHEFVMRLPEAYETFIAEGGGGLSGGQKQRIAIARALIRNPRILLLDEATSALDTRSEAAVQKALENARVGRTVVIVAHRLSTVRDADVIMVVDGGVIKESGNHSELVKMNGIYAKLVRKSDEETSDEVEDEAVEESDEESMEIRHRVHKQGDDEYDKRSVVSFKSLSTVSSTVSVLEPKISATKEVLRLNKPEKVFLIFGVLMAVVNGIINTLFPIMYAEMYDIFQDPDSQNQLDRTIVLAILLLVLAVFRVAATTFGVSLHVRAIQN
uniref:Uncharacterized protein n=1 Tax=Schistocephalus solidus TaxID=70667 RepID=A0A0V0J156_SCHSO